MFPEKIQKIYFLYVALMLSYKLDFSSCAIKDGCCKSSHNYEIKGVFQTYHI